MRKSVPDQLSQVEMDILISINDKRYMSKVAKDANVNVGNITLVCNKLKKKELIYRRKDGKLRIVMLTEKGKRIQELLFRLKNQLANKGEA